MEWSEIDQCCLTEIVHIFNEQKGTCCDKIKKAREYIYKHIPEPLDKVTQNDILNNVYLVHGFTTDPETNRFLERFVIEGTGNNTSIKYSSCSGKTKMDRVNCEKYIHTTWGVLVFPHLNGQWDSMDNAIIVPLKNQQGRIFKINPSDTMVFTKLNIEKNNSFFVYNTKKEFSPEILKKIKDAGFTIIKYTKDPLDQEEYDKVINQIKKMQNGNLVINGYDYGKISNTDYNEDILGCNRPLNDRKTLIYMLRKLKADPSWSEPHENYFNQIKNLLPQLGIDVTCETIKKYYLNIFEVDRLISQKQWKILYPMATDILFKRQTLRTTIDNIPEIKNSYQNNYCEEKEGITKYTHPTPCFNYMGRNYRLGDENLMSDELKQNKLDKKLLVGRHLGLDRDIIPTDFIDSIQYYTAYYDVDDSLAISKPKKEDIQKWRKEKEEVFSRTNKQFKFSKKVKAEIEKKMDELGFY